MLSLYRWWGRELLLFCAWGSQCKERQNNNTTTKKQTTPPQKNKQKTPPPKKRKKRKKKVLWTPFQHSGQHPSPLFPTPKTTHLHLHLQACLSACQHRGGYRSHHSSGYLSKKNVLKETPKAQWCNPTPCHRARPHRAAHRLFFLLGKWPVGFTGRSSWRQVIVVEVFAALRDHEALKQAGAPLARTRIIRGISFLSFWKSWCDLKECFMRPRSLLYYQLEE